MWSQISTTPRFCLFKGKYTAMDFLPKIYRNYVDLERKEF